MSSGLTQVQINELKSAFGMMDDNRDGKLTPEEIRRVIKKLNFELSEYDVNELISSLDADNDGKVNFDEFVTRYGERYAKKRPREEFESVFREFDQDGSGLVDDHELFNMVRKFNPGISKHQVDHMIDSIDRDNSGKISFDEFMELMNK